MYRLILQAMATGDASTQIRLSNLAADAAGMEQFLDLFEAYLVRRVHRRPEPVGADPAPDVPLVTWAELWEKAAQAGREVVTYNLDRKQFVLELLENSADALGRHGIPISR